MDITTRRFGLSMLALCAGMALGGCSSTDGAAMAPSDSGGTSGNAANSGGNSGTGSDSSNLASSPTPGMPRTPETSANGAVAQDTARGAMQDARDTQDARDMQDMRRDSRQDMRNPPPISSDDTGSTALQGVGARGVAQSVELVPRSQALGVGGSVAGAAVGGAVGSRADNASPGDMVYRIIVRFDDGTTRSMMQDSAAGIQDGDRVRVDSKGMLMRE